MAEQLLWTDRLREARRRAREVVVGVVLWHVYEMPPHSYDRRATPSLIFESDRAIRRVRNYPEAWRALTDEELLALSWAI